ncbi:pancreatic triacylglycerol lipase-like [Hyposmocoma kahamanoa]|uniref:pancreatic triacylglycerol lipase-like n=1 Tax=Hyposmocoma kahamanoa TaxID=1477025 RepID=UPI000E6D7382|nr:pancreatic triacylglycerol lipase-like [Hyposmocoma kahamanoa]
MRAIRICLLYIVFQVIVFQEVHGAKGHPWIRTTDELENHISPEDLQEFLNTHSGTTTSGYATTSNLDYADAFQETTTRSSVPEVVDCFGLGSLTNSLPWLFNMKPDTAEKVNTHFYMSSRDKNYRVQVYPGKQFGLEWVDFKASRKTIMIVHGFMSHSNASWVTDMARALLDWGDVNVIAVDWSGGGNTWKYWRAVANTRQVGSDIIGFLRQLMNATGAKVKDFHFIGHSLGAHIVSYVSFHLGGVGRITGLDPAQPCFRTSNLVERLDANDADFVDVIHTNGRLLTKIGFGLPDPIGTADFYPNGGMKQPGCVNSSNSIWAQVLPSSVSGLQQAICSHGRAYLLFTESLITRSNCTFRAHRWNLTYEGVNTSLEAACDRQGSCAEMGVRAVGGNGLPKASGPYFALTTEKQPYCPTEFERHHPRADLLHDLREGFRLDRHHRTTTKLPGHADSMFMESTTKKYVTTTTKSSWFDWWFG